MIRPSPSSLSLPLLLTAMMALPGLACSPDDVSNDEAGVTTAAEETADEAASDGNDENDENGESNDDEASFIQDEGPGEGDGGAPGNLGDPCQGQGDCAEDLVCNSVPMLGGICSECTSDADCDGGNCTFNGSWFACGDGSLGQMCESDDSCADGLYCAEILDAGGLINTALCSECADDSHCPDGQLCAPTLDFMTFSGQRSCIDPGTHPQDSVCDVLGAGDEQCEGLCTTASFMNVLEVGVCGECESDEDCMGGACAEATFGLGGVAGSTCG